jgi:hypothetical protein
MHTSISEQRYTLSVIAVVLRHRRWVRHAELSLCIARGRNTRDSITRQVDSQTTTIRLFNKRAASFGLINSS